MKYRVGDGGDNLDKYLDPEAYYDPYFYGKCDELVTNSGAFRSHNMLHKYSKSFDPLSGSGGCGGVDDKRASLSKTKKRKWNARRKAGSIDDAHDSSLGKKKKRKWKARRKAASIDAAHDEKWAEAMEECAEAEKLESDLQREYIRCFPCKRVYAARESFSTHLQISSRHNYCHFCDTDFVFPEVLKQHSLMCKARSQLAAFPGTTTLDQTEKRETDGVEAGKSEQGLDLSTEMGKLELNDGTERREEAIKLDE